MGLLQIELKRMMTFEASDCRLVRQGMKLVAHYQRQSHLSCLLTACCFRAGSDSVGQNDSVYVVFPLGCFTKIKKSERTASLVDSDVVE